jgi:very-short-patch-repair endonuclease
VDVADLLYQAPNGVATWSQLKPYVTERQLAIAMGSGRVERAGRGVYRLSWAPPDYGIVAALRGTLSHLSAARHHGLSLIRDPAETYVTVRANRSGLKAPKGVRVFYRDIPPERRSGDVTDIVRTVLDCARDCPIPDALAVADSALRDNRLDRGELLEAAALLRGHGCRRARQIVQWADARAASVMESALRGLLCEAGLAIFEPQFPIEISTGDVLHSDLGHATTRTVIEADSVLNHVGPARLEIDAQRYDEFAAAGYVVLRFTWRQITGRPDWVVDMVRRTLRQRGWA